MANVTINGNGYSDDGTAGRDMRNGGHRQWLLPMLSDTMAAINVVADTLNGQLSWLRITAGGSFADNTAAALHIRGSANNGAQGITIDNFKPALSLIDRSGAAYSFRWVADGGSMMLEPDNGDAGATWQGYKVAIGRYGNACFGNGGISSAVQLYVRGNELTGTTQWGIYNYQSFTAEATVQGNCMATAPIVADAVFTMPNLRAHYIQNPSIGAQAVVDAYTGLQVDNALATNIGTVYAARLRQSSGTNRWNLYADGSAQNYLYGTVLIGGPTDNGNGDKLQITGSVYASQHYKVGANQVVGARKTGWSAMTGTAARTAAAAHAAQTIAASYTQSQIQNIDNSVVIVSQRLKALIDDLTTHGLIGA